jgi:hypothetical protein
MSLCSFFKNSFLLSPFYFLVLPSTSFCFLSRATRQAGGSPIQCELKNLFWDRIYFGPIKPYVVMSRSHHTLRRGLVDKKQKIKLAPISSAIYLN